MSLRSHLCGRHVKRMLAVARVEILILIHDRPTISLILLVPAIQIVLFGYAVNLNPKNISIAIAGDSGDLMRDKSTARSKKPGISQSSAMG